MVCGSRTLPPALETRAQLAGDPGAFAQELADALFVGGSKAAGGKRFVGEAALQRATEVSGGGVMELGQILDQPATPAPGIVACKARMGYTVAMDERYGFESSFRIAR